MVTTRPFSLGNRAIWARAVPFRGRTALSLSTRRGRRRAPTTRRAPPCTCAAARTRASRGAGSAPPTTRSSARARSCPRAARLRVGWCGLKLKEGATTVAVARPPTGSTTAQHLREHACSTGVPSSWLSCHVWSAGQRGRPSVVITAAATFNGCSPARRADLLGERAQRRLRRLAGALVPA